MPAPVPRSPAARLAAMLSVVAAMAVAAPACEAPLDPAPRYLEPDGDYRREVLERALWRPELPYSQSLLGSYGLQDMGWDLLGEMPTRVRPFRTADAEALAATGELPEGELGELRPAAWPSGETGWRALGERVFFELPMRYDSYLTWALARPALWPAVGLEPGDDGSLRGVVVFEDRAGERRAGITCAFCHAEGGVAGRAERRLDVGLVRAEYYEAVGVDDTERFRGWGPGRADVTDDPQDSPTQIPDLWGLAHARYLNHSGAIAVDGPQTLAVRFETQYILGHRMRSRPPRGLIWALARFVTGLEPPADGPFAPAPHDPADVEAGAAAFGARCAGCHDPDRGYAGGLVPTEALNVDPAVATTPERGTGHYKVPSLVAVRANAPYLHNGSAPTLDALLAGGHPSGEPVDAATRAALIAFLDTL